MNIKETLDALHSASNKISALKAKLNEKVSNYELGEEVGDYELDVDVRYDLYDREFSIELFYIRETQLRQQRKLTINCVWANLIINTTTTDAQKIKKLTEFCENYILRGLDDE